MDIVRGIDPNKGRIRLGTHMVGTLADLCLSVVAHSFQKFCAAVESSHWKGPMHFLVRTYSEEIFCRLMLADQLKSEYLDILINPYFKTLDLEGSKVDTMEQLVHYMKSCSNNIQSLKSSIPDKESYDLYKNLLLYLPNLQCIHISYISTYILRNVKMKDIVKNCKLLKTLIMPPGICKKLMRWIYDFSFVLDHCSLLENLYGVDTVCILYKKHAADFKSGSLGDHKYALTSLSTYHSSADGFRICALLCPYITSIKLYELIDMEILQLCTEFSFLKHIDLDFHAEGCFSALSSDSLNHFLKLRGSQLVTFCMSGGCLSLHTLLVHCPNLQSLVLANVTYMTCSDKKNLFSEMRFPFLKVLGFERSNCSVEAIANSLTLLLSVTAMHLESLSLLGCQGLTEDFVLKTLKLGSMYHVQKMILDETDVMPSLVTALLLNDSLQQMSIRRCQNISRTDYFNLLRKNQNGKVHFMWSKYNCIGCYFRYHEGRYYESFCYCCSYYERDNI